MSYKMLIILLVLQICIVDGFSILGGKRKKEGQFKNRDPSPYYKCVQNDCGRFVESNSAWGFCMNECMKKVMDGYTAEVKVMPFLV